MSPDPRVYGFQSPQDFERVVRAALQGGRPDLTGAPSQFAPGATREAKVYVTVTGDKYENDRRDIYPAVFWVRNTNNTHSDPASQDWYGVGKDQYLPQPGNDCVAVTPNGEVLRKNSRYEGRLVGTWRCGDPRTYAGVLGVRVDGTSGELEMAPPNYLLEGQTINISWAGGSQTNHGVTFSSGVVVAFGGGGGAEGDSELPDVGTAVTVRVTQEVQVSVVLVDCTDAVEIIRTVNTRNADGDYLGYVQEFDVSTNSWMDGEEVWVRNAN